MLSVSYASSPSEFRPLEDEVTNSIVACKPLIRQDIWAAGRDPKLLQLMDVETFKKRMIRFSFLMFVIVSPEPDESRSNLTGETAQRNTEMHECITVKIHVHTYTSGSAVNTSRVHIYLGEINKEMLD